MANAAVSLSVADRLAELGGVDVARVRATPPPGTATSEDLQRINRNAKPLCELVDQTIVEKAMGYEASVVAGAILEILRRWIVPRKLGFVSGADGMFRLPTNDVRGPDVAFLSNERKPDGKFPIDAYPALAPDLAVEVLSRGNTKAEMSRKRIEYFNSGVRLVWIVDCGDRSVAVYTSPSNVIVIGEVETIEGGDVLPGFSSTVASFFIDLD